MTQCRDICLSILHLNLLTHCRDANLSIQHDAYRVLESPSGASGKVGPTTEENKFLQPSPEIPKRGQKAIDNDMKKIFRAYARPTSLFPGTDANMQDAGGKHDSYSDKKIGELLLGTNLSQKDKFEGLDDNGNGRLSSRELKMGMRNMGKIWLGLKRIKVFLGSKADDDLSYNEFISIVKDRIAER